LGNTASKACNSASTALSDKQLRTERRAAVRQLRAAVPGLPEADYDDIFSDVFLARGHLWRGEGRLRSFLRLYMRKEAIKRKGHLRTQEEWGDTAEEDVYNQGYSAGLQRGSDDEACEETERPRHDRKQLGGPSHIFFPITQI